MAEKLGVQDTFAPAGIVYAPNQPLLDALDRMRISDQKVWSEKAVTTEFPKALHGPDLQSLTVRTKEELDLALTNGWSLRPVVEDERAPTAPPSPSVGPKKAIKKQKVA